MDDRPLKSSEVVMLEHLLDDIRSRAYEIWLSEGCPDGRAAIHWVRAEAEFREKLAAASLLAGCKRTLRESPRWLSHSMAANLTAGPGR